MRRQSRSSVSKSLRQTMLSYTPASGPLSISILPMRATLGGLLTDWSARSAPPRRAGRHVRVTPARRAHACNSVHIIDTTRYRSEVVEIGHRSLVRVSRRARGPAIRRRMHRTVRSAQVRKEIRNPANGGIVIYVLVQTGA